MTESNPSGQPSFNPVEREIILGVNPNKGGFGEFSQSRTAIITAVVIIFITDLFSIISLQLFSEIGGGTPSTPSILASTAIDIFLGIHILRGKRWAKTWMVVRMIAGIVVWGIVYTVQNDFASVILNTGVLMAIVLLLTLPSKRITILGGIVLTIAAYVVGLFIPIFGPMLSITSVPENNFIPASFSTYTSDGSFCVSYPSDWEPRLDAITFTEAQMKSYLETEGFETQLEDFQLAFLGEGILDNGNFALMFVAIEPGTSWPLETIIESTHQWSSANIDKYEEYSRVKTTIGGKDAIIQTYQGEDEYYILTGYTVAYISSEKFLWTVLCACNVEDFEYLNVTFDQIVRSLRIEH